MSKESTSFRIHEIVPVITTKEMADYSAVKSYQREIISIILPTPQIPESLRRQQFLTFPKTIQRKIFPTALRLQRHQCEANDGHSKRTQWTNPGVTHYLFFNLISRNIEAEEP
jgi:hypothetical protein